MEVTGKTELIIGMDEIRIGDQIFIDLGIWGKFTATAQKVTDDSILFLFDTIVTKRRMNEGPTNKGGFEKSDLNHWLHNVLLPKFPEELRQNISCITIPSYGEIFSHDYEAIFYYKVFAPDKDTQFESMECKGNRVCDFNGNWCCWWLRNATREDVSSAYFAGVDGYGEGFCGTASYSYGVRPEFWLIK